MDGYLNMREAILTIWCRKRRPQRRASRPKLGGGRSNRCASASEKPRPKTDRLSYKEVRALELLPADMERLGNEIAGLEQALADPGLYGRDPAAFRKKADALEAARTRLAEMEEQWLQLEMKREELEA